MHACFPLAKAAKPALVGVRQSLARLGWKSAPEVQSAPSTGLHALLQMVHPVAEIAEAKDGNVQPKTDDFRDLVSNSQAGAAWPSDLTQAAMLLRIHVVSAGHPSGWQSIHWRALRGRAVSADAEEAAAGPTGQGRAE